MRATVSDGGRLRLGVRSAQEEDLVGVAQGAQTVGDDEDATGRAGPGRVAARGEQAAQDADSESADGAASVAVAAAELGEAPAKKK